MKKCWIFIVGLMFVLGLSACGHQHIWEGATCTEPKTCSDCGITEGEALGHIWTEATCTESKTCTECGTTEGEALGHTWTNATCTKPKTCTECGITEGKALEHTWDNATCVAPKICIICETTEGKALGHDTPELTCTNDAACSRCNEIVEAPGHKLTDATCTEASKCTVCGETVGKALGHTSKDGKCLRCNKEVYTTVKGNGYDFITDISVGDGLYKVHAIFNGDGTGEPYDYFELTTYDARGESYKLLMGLTDGGTVETNGLLLGKAPFDFEIKADGDWEYTIEKLGYTSATEFSGKGDNGSVYITDICKISSGAWEFTHDGSLVFGVYLYTTAGRELVATGFGECNIVNKIKIPEGSNAVFEIVADGNWTIKRKSNN